MTDIIVLKGKESALEAAPAGRGEFLLTVSRPTGEYCSVVLTKKQIDKLAGFAANHTKP